jgi:Putative lumazine-binding
MRYTMWLLFALMPAVGGAQDATERDAVLKSVQVFFDAMTARDVDGMRKVLLAEGRFHFVDTRQAEPLHGTFTGEESFGRLQKSTQTHRERIWDPDVRVRGPIAIVWAPYDFWTDGTFSHCGVDAFDLVKTDEGWRIVGGTFTMEAKCAPSPLGPLKP